MGKIMRHFHRSFAAFAAGMLAVFAFAVPAAKAQNHPISPNDLVEVLVFQEEDMGSKARVGNDGTINLPFINSVRIGGKTTDEAAQIIRARLAKGYLVNPQVTVTVLEYAKRRFSVLGQVNKSGSIDFPDTGGVDLLTAIAMAGGYTRIADPGKISVKRLVNGKEQVYKLNAKTMAADPASNRFDVQPGDVITVGESAF